MTRLLTATTDAARSSLDPITRLQAPPRNETSPERHVRLAGEAEAQRVSDAIDKALEKEKKEQLQKLKNQRQDVLLLLLGPQGSGKSTFVRQLRLRYDFERLASERDTYRLTIFLSLIQTTRCLLDVLETDTASVTLPNLRADLTMASLPSSSSPAAAGPSGSGGTGGGSGNPPASPSPSPMLRRNEATLRRMWLAPMLSLEEGLKKHIGVVAEDPSSVSFKTLAASGTSLHDRRQSFSTMDSSSEHFDHELIDIGAAAYHVFPSRWLASSRTAFSSRVHVSSARASNQLLPLPLATESQGWSAPSGDTSYLLESCRDEVADLWGECVRRGLVEGEEGPRENNRALGGVRLSESARYFLDALDRVASHTYVPSDEDLMHARIRTVGVEEHMFKVENQVYHVVDVAGAKGSRAIWASYFEHARACIFIVSLAAYDEPSAHDSKINALADALDAFEQVAGNKLMKMVDLILFLNKIDIFKRKIKAGIPLPSSVFPNFRGPMDCKAIGTYIKEQFKLRNARVCEGSGRVIYTFFTQNTDVKQTRLLISSIKDVIVRRVTLTSLL